MSQKNQAKSSGPIRELIGFIVFSLSVFFLISLISYSPSDPSFNTKVMGVSVEIQNLGGKIGAYCGDLLMQGFGLASFVFVILMSIVSVKIVLNALGQHFKIRLFGAVLLIFTLCLFLSLIDRTVHYPSSWGGVLGFYTKKIFKTYMGSLGTYLFVICSAVIAMVLSFEWSVQKMFLKAMKVKDWISANYLDALKSRVLGLMGELPTIFKNKFKRKINIQERNDNDLSAQIDNEPESFKPSRNVIQIGRVKNIPIVTLKKNKEKQIALPNIEVDKSEAMRPSTDYQLPSLELLDSHLDQELKINKDELLSNAQILENKLKDFGVIGKVVEVQPGPVVTMYEFEPAPGVKVNQITRLNDDLALALKALSVRITLLPGKSVIGIEVANRDRQIVYFKDIVEDRVFHEGGSFLNLAFGKDISGSPYATDLRKMPHLLIAGATGSGKSVAVNSMILSVLFRATPKDVRMILVDPKMLELSLYDDIPHLLLPVVTDPRKAAAALRWAVAEMERRYRLMADLGVRNLEGYNKKVLKLMEDNPLQTTSNQDGTNENEHTGTLPFIMIVIDELADLMMVSSKEVEESIIRLAQMARASGIHLLLATQRPSVDVITGVIKANMPARVSFQVSSKIDSRTIIDANGAESLLGAGDMLFLPPGTSKLLRIHGAFVTDQEVEKVTKFWKMQAKPSYDENILKNEEESAFMDDPSDPDNELYKQAIEIVKSGGLASISLIQRRLRIGYNRAARLVERMDEEGLLAPGEVGKPREINMSRFV